MVLSRAASVIALFLAALCAPQFAVGQSSDEPASATSDASDKLERSNESEGSNESEPSAKSDETEEAEESKESNTSDESSHSEGSNKSDGSDESDESNHVEGSNQSDRSDGSDQSATYEDLSSKERLGRAERAFGEGSFGKIPPLLEPLLEDEPAFDREERLVRARELLGVGLFFEAQQTTDPERRDALMQEARSQFLELLRVRPDYELDSLIFPASVVDLFESVREKHADELDEIRQAKQTTGGGSATGGGKTTTVYVQRNVEKHVYALNFFPFGIGQFQNEDAFKGVVLGGGQLAALAVHGIGFWRIESLRKANGKLPHPDQCGGCQDALLAENWRTAQWVAVGIGGAIYLASVVDALTNYEPTDVQIRMRDKPPPELSSSDSAAGNGPAVEIGFGSVRIRW